MRKMLIAFGCGLLLAAAVAWLDGRGLTESATTQSTTQQSGAVRTSGTTTISSSSSSTAAPYERRSDTAIVALLTLGALLILAGALFERLLEMEYGGMVLRFRASDVPEALATLGGAAADAETAEHVTREFVERLSEEQQGRRVMPSDALVRAARGAVNQVAPDLAEQISLTGSGPTTVVRVDPPTGGWRTIAVTTQRHYLREDLFPGLGGRRIEEADTESGRALFATQADGDVLLAAARFDLDPPRPILLEALATRVDVDWAGPARIAAHELIQYLHAIARRTASHPGVFFSPSAPGPQLLSVLGSLGFRPATPEEAARLPPGRDYWVQDPA